MRECEMKREMISILGRMLLFGVVGILFVMLAGHVRVAESGSNYKWQQLRIGDGKNWSFIGAPWRDGNFPGSCVSASVCSGGCADAD
jgi:hypothetical protein